MLSTFALINMNGRMYDPLLGRMLSPDNVIKDPTGTQYYNRYSYAYNNPLKFTDPTGWVGEDDDDDMAWADDDDDDEAPATSNSTAAPSYNFNGGGTANNPSGSNSSGEGGTDVLMTVGVWLSNGGPINDAGNILYGATNAAIGAVVSFGDMEQEIGQGGLSNVAQRLNDNMCAVICDVTGVQAQNPDVALAQQQINTNVSAFIGNIPQMSWDEKMQTVGGLGMNGYLLFSGISELAGASDAAVGADASNITKMMNTTDFNETVESMAFDEIKKTGAIQVQAYGDGQAFYNTFVQDLDAMGSGYTAGNGTYIGSHDSATQGFIGQFTMDYNNGAGAIFKIRFNQIIPYAPSNAGVFGPAFGQ